MAGESNDADLQQAPESVVAPQAGDTHDEPEAQAGPPVVTESDEPERKYIPKERFDQVYARSKDAEVKLQAEREQRARLEGELDAMKRQPTPPPQPTPQRYTEAQLQAMIDEGKATVGQALAYQAETLKLDVARQVEEKVRTTLASSTKTSTLQQEMERYKAVIPEVTQVGSPERMKVEQEFKYLVNLGYDGNDPRTELMAVRAALGSVETVQERQRAKTITPGRETMQDVQAAGGAKQGEPDVLKKMTAAQRQHYQRMIDRNVYTSWDEVRAELKEYAASGGR